MVLAAAQRRIERAPEDVITHGIGHRHMLQSRELGSCRLLGGVHPTSHGTAPREPVKRALPRGYRDARIGAYACSLEAVAATACDLTSSSRSKDHAAARRVTRRWLFLS